MHSTLGFIIFTQQVVLKIKSTWFYVINVNNPFQQRTGISLQFQTSRSYNILKGIVLNKGSNALFLFVSDKELSVTFFTAAT